MSVHAAHMTLFASHDSVCVLPNHILPQVTTVHDRKLPFME